MAQAYISHVHDDASKASELKEALERIGIEACTPISIPAGTSVSDGIAQALWHSDILIVLLGKNTRYSEWVDKEIEIALSQDKGGKPSGLLAIILPEHEDFGSPYYDPENVPIRIHDALQWESGVLRKWSSGLTDLGSWIEEANLRRQRIPRPRLSFSAQSELHTFRWDKSVDVNRPSL